MKAILRSINNFSCKLKQNNNLKYDISPKVRSNKFKSISGNGNVVIEDAIKRNLKDYKIYGNTKQQILPDGYTQVDYIESSGTQYIDTGVNADYKLSLKTKLTDILNTQKHMGAIRNNGNGTYVRHHFQTKNSNIQGSVVYYVDGLYYQIKNTSEQTNPHIYNIDVYNNTIQFDNEEPITITRTNFDTELNYWLFWRNRNENIGNQDKGYFRIYYCKMYVENELVRDFIPCYRNSDNEIGLYDLVNDVFYTNQGTGTFTYGNAAPTPHASIEMVSVGDNKTGLPVGYTQVDYIESSGTQYIDMGLKGNHNTKIVTSALFKNGGTFVGDITDSSQAISLRFSPNNPSAISRFGDKSVTGIFATYSHNKRYLIETSSSGVKVDNNIIHQWQNITPFATVLNLYLFKNTTSAESMLMILYSCKVYENNELVRDFIPCYRNSDNEVGLYDLVNNVFYTNQGSGVFTYGSVVEKGGYKIPINVRSDNLFDKDNFIDGYIDSSGIYHTDSSIKANALSDYIKIDNNTDYIFSAKNNIYGLNFALYDSNKVFIKRVTSNNTSYNQINSETANYCRVWCNISQQTNITSELIEQYEIQLIKSSSKPSKYIPYYNETTNIYLDEPLRKIGEYSDYIDFENGKIVKNTSEIVLNGSEPNWFKGSDTSSNYYILNQIINAIGNYSDGLSNYFINAKKYPNGRKGLFAIRENGTSLMFNSDETTVGNWKNWLSENNVTVDYILATPTEEDIELPNINLIEGKNIITIGTDLQGVFETEYYSKEIIDISNYKYNLRKVED